MFCFLNSSHHSSVPQQREGEKNRHQGRSVNNKLLETKVTKAVYSRSKAKQFTLDCVELQQQLLTFIQFKRFLYETKHKHPGVCHWDAAITDLKFTASSGLQCLIKLQCPHPKNLLFLCWHGCCVLYPPRYMVLGSFLEFSMFSQLSSEDSHPQDDMGYIPSNPPLPSSTCLAPPRTQHK